MNKKGIDPNHKPIEKWTWIDLHRDCQLRNNLRIVMLCHKLAK